MLLFVVLSAFRVGERWEKKAKKGLSSVGKLFRIMSRAALCSAEFYSTYFLFSKNVDLKTELSFYHYTLHCTKLELCEVALGWFSGICFCSQSFLFVFYRCSRTTSLGLFLSVGNSSFIFFNYPLKNKLKSIEKINVLLERWATKTMTENQPCVGKSLFYPFLALGVGTLNLNHKKKHLFVIFYLFFIGTHDIASLSYFFILFFFFIGLDVVFR